MKRILFIGDEDFRRVVSKYINYDVGYITYFNAGGNSRADHADLKHDFKRAAIRTFYDAVVIYHKSGRFAKVIHSAGYRRPIIGVVPKIDSKVPYATVNVVMNTPDTKDFELQGALDTLLYKIQGS